jgi:DNA-binding NarL/FixJ family response regulator
VIRVVIVEDSPVYREGLARAVEADAELVLLHEVPTVEQLPDDGGDEPRVALLDLELPGQSGPAAVLALTERGYRVLVVSGHHDRELVLAAMSAGARGYLTKASEIDEILCAVRLVGAGSTYVSPTLASFLLAEAGTGGPSPYLTPQERRILSLLARGERDRDIAEELTISLHTVHSHLERIREKTGKRRRAELAQLAVLHGLTGHDKPPLG